MPRIADVDLELSCSDNPEVRASEAFSSLMGYYKEYSPRRVAGSVRNGLGATGKLPRRLDRTRRQFLLRPVLGNFRAAGLSKDHGPHKVRHYYAVSIKGPQGTVVDCRSPDKDGGDL